MNMSYCGLVFANFGSILQSLDIGNYKKELLGSYLPHNFVDPRDKIDQQGVQYLNQKKWKKIHCLLQWEE